jgi:segregation and condensation protein B
MILKTKLEALLYIKARPLGLEELARLSLCSKEEVYDGLSELIDDYSYRESALEVVETDQGFALQLRPGYESLVQEHVPAELGIGAQRTLALIALRGPLTQSELIDLRGSGAYDQVRDLVRLGFISKNKESAGRSYRLRVTDKFHQYFAVTDVQALLDSENSLDQPQST